MIFHQNPKILRSEALLSSGDSMDLNNLGFFMAFGLENIKSTSQQADSIFSVDILKNSREASLKIPISGCSIENLTNSDVFRDFFAKKNLSQFFCVNGQNLKNLKIDDFLEITVNRCSNSTSSNPCATPEKITDYIESSNLGVYLLKNIVDPSDYEKPFTNFVEDFHFPINSKSFNGFEILLNRVSFFSDNGVVFEDLNEINSFSYEPNQKLKNLGSEGALYRIELRFDRIKTNFKRSYEKFQNVLAYIGGTMKALMVILNVILFPITRFQFRVSLANSTFRFKTPKEAKAIIKKKIQPKTPKSHAIKFSKLEESYFMHYLGSNDKRLHMSSFRYYFRCFRDALTNIFTRLLNKGLHQMDRVLDISYILHKLTEVESLKVLLLDETQKDLFDMIPKPEVALYEGMKTDAYRRISQSFQKKRIRSKSAFNEFQMIANKAEKSLIDEKLLEMWPKLKKIKEKENSNDSDNTTKSETIIGQFKPVKVSKFYKKVQKGYKQNSIEPANRNISSYS